MRPAPWWKPRSTGAEREQRRSARTGRFYYGWVVVAVTFLTLMVAAGVRSAPGVLIYPIETEFGWSRAAISLAVSIGLLLYGLSGPLAGQLMDRFGPRRVMLFGLLVTGGSTAISTAIAEVWQLDLVWGLLSGLGTGVTGSVLGVAVANRWFVAQRGLVTGLFGAAFSAGQLVFLPLLMWLVVATGWRGALAVLAVAVLLVLVPVLALMRDDPSDLGLQPYGGAALPPSPLAAAGLLGGVTGRAVRTPAFWLLAGTFIVCGITTNGLIGTHLVPHSIERGIPEITAAGAMGLMGAMMFVGALISGWLTDRCDPRKLLAGYYCLRGLSLFWLPFVGDFPSLAIFAVFYGLEFAATLAPTAALAADLFGRRNAGTIYGWIFFLHQVGAAAAAYLGGVARASLGDYQLSFLLAGGLGLLGALLALCVQRGEQRVPVAAEG